MDISQKFVVNSNMLSQRKSMECIQIYIVFLPVATHKSKKKQCSKTLTKVHLDTTLPAKTPHDISNK